MSSSYVVIRAGSQITGECTNIGIITYDADGKLFDVCVYIDRAIRRGDLSKKGLVTAESIANNCRQSLATLEQLERYRGTMAAAMSCIWRTSAYPSRGGPDELMARMFSELVPADEVVE